MVKLWLHPKQETRELACQNKIYEKLNPGSSLRLQAQAPDSGSGLQAGSANSLFGLVVKPRKLINRRRLASESERQSRGRFECFHGRLLLNLYNQRSVCEFQRLRPIDRTPGIPGSEKNRFCEILTYIHIYNLSPL